MHYSAGVAGLAVSGAATALPGNGALWLAARVLLDCAGGLFGLYLLTGLGLSLTGRVMRIRHAVAANGPRQPK
jgi:hypothetical protein